MARGRAVTRAVPGRPCSAHRSGDTACGSPLSAPLPPPCSAVGVGAGPSRHKALEAGAALRVHPEQHSFPLSAPSCCVVPGFNKVSFSHCTFSSLPSFPPPSPLSGGPLLALCPCAPCTRQQRGGGRGLKAGWAWSPSGGVAKGGRAGGNRPRWWREAAAPRGAAAAPGGPAPPPPPPRPGTPGTPAPGHPRDPPGSGAGSAARGVPAVLGGR